MSLQTGIIIEEFSRWFIYRITETPGVSYRLQCKRGVRGGLYNRITGNAPECVTGRNLIDEVQGGLYMQNNRYPGVSYRLESNQRGSGWFIYRITDTWE